MCGGGGTPTPSPDRSVELENARARNEAAAEQRRREQEQARFASDTEAFNTQLTGAKSNALTRGLGLINERGLNPEQYQSDLQAELDRIALGINGPTLGTAGFSNPASYYTDDIASIILDRNRDSQRRQYENQILGFAPDSFALDRIPDTLDDPILQSILTPQFEDANTQLLNSFNTGNLSRSGLETARRNLEEQRTGSLAKLNQIGGDVLSQGRSSLRDVRDSGLNQARSFELGQSFDPGSIQGRLDTTFGDFNTNLEGSIRNSLGSEPLFDINRILASTRQNAFNPARGNEATGLLQALASRDEKREEQRGVGNTGAF